jgi:hypothetical protein
MDKRVVQSTQYTTKKLSIVSKIGEIDITGIFEEINIYDSILYPCMNGTVIISDSIGLSDKLSFDGSETIVIEMGKTSDAGILKKSFRIYKQGPRTSANMSSESYMLYFISEEFILSQLLKLRRSYKDTYSKMVSNILKEYLQIEDASIGMIEQSLGNRIMVFPSLSPFDAINLCSRRAVNYINSPTFLFFENKFGYNFVTTSTLLGSKESFTINFQPKNLKDDRFELYGARHYEVVSQFDLNKNITSGVYGSRYIGFDTSNRSLVVKNIDFSNTYELSEHANKMPNIGLITNKLGKITTAYDAKVVFQPTNVLDQTSSWTKEKDPYSIDVSDDNYNYLVQREALFRNLMSKRIRAVMPGNFDLTSGLTANLIVPKRGEKAVSENIEDKSLSGKYLIIAARHIINYQKHETVIEVATDSNNRDAVYTSTNLQNESLEIY